MKIGIFGGTFNPPHKTHLQIVRQAVCQLGLDKLLVFPCGDPPHKVCTVNKLHRLQMTRLAFANQTCVEVNDFELNAQGKSYTLKTLQYVKQLYPDAKLYLIIGADSLNYLDKWYQPDKIVSLATVVTFGRCGFDTQSEINRQSQRFNCPILQLEGEITGDNSTQIRLLYQFGFDVDAVTDEVDNYVKENGLYSQYNDLCQKLATYLKPSRLWHTFYVVKAGLKLPSQCNADDVFVACALHDVAKYVSPLQYHKYGFDAGDLPQSVVHAFLGEKVAQVDFGITNRQVLDAIKYHTTARPNMTELDMVVYVADKVEESRPYPIAHLWRDTLEETFFETLKEASQVVKQSGKQIHPLTQQAVDFYTKKLIKED